MSRKYTLGTGEPLESGKVSFRIDLTGLLPDAFLHRTTVEGDGQFNSRTSLRVHYIEKKRSKHVHVLAKPGQAFWDGMEH
jgi:hypothetical protein